MNLIRTVATSLIIPVFVTLGIGLIAALICPTIWDFLGSERPLEKVFQKSGLVLLTLTAIFANSKSTFWGMGLTPTRTTNRQLLAISKGWVIGVITLSIPICFLVFLKIRITDKEAFSSVINIVRVLISAIFTGLIIGLIEEYIFRGWVLGWLQKKLSQLQTKGDYLAIIVSAFYFSILHFLVPETEINNQSNTISAGMNVFKASLKNLFQHDNFDTLFSLFLAGIFLGIIKLFYSKNNGLLLVIGIHAGWVFSIKTTKSLTDSSSINEWGYLVGQDGIVGHLSAGWLGTMIIVLLIYKSRLNKTQSKKL